VNCDWEPVIDSGLTPGVSIDLSGKTSQGLMWSPTDRSFHRFPRVVIDTVTSCRLRYCAERRVHFKGFQTFQNVTGCRRIAVSINATMYQLFRSKKIFIRVYNPSVNAWRCFPWGTTYKMRRGKMWLALQERSKALPGSESPFWTFISMFLNELSYFTNLFDSN